MENIHINQLGYREDDKKTFIINDECLSFKVIEKITGQIAFEGKTSYGVKDKATEEIVAYGDFTKLNTSGEYYIITTKGNHSYNFNINNNVYSEVKEGLLKALYYQRCGEELSEKKAGLWCHPICHRSEGLLYENLSSKIDVSGGWHDAGDYGRYVVAGAKAVADLLLTYDFFPGAFKAEEDSADILEEAKYELDWLLKMQDISTGGVYHKVTTQFFPGMIMPEDDVEPLIIYPISSTATGDFAAIMALASRIYNDIDPEFSKSCLQASENAWKWLVNNSEPVLFKNPPNMNSGEYGDDIDLDERYWAAAELYRTTGNVEYHEYFRNAFKNLLDTNSLGWADVGGYGSIAYLFTENSKVDLEIYKLIKARFIEQAEVFVKISEESGYKVTLLPNQYIWGSNMNILNNAMHLVIANIINPNQSYIEVVFSQWNYMFGLNSLNQSFLTGFGSNPIMHPHHRPSEGDKIIAPVPGMISGGPCSSLLDDAAVADCKGLSPAKCFTDNVESYSTNEITIYWNSPGIFVAGFLNK